MNTKGKIRLGYLVLAICSIYFVATLINQQKLFNAGQRELKMLEEKLEEERTENKRLRRDLEIIGTDEYIERIAREKLGMVKRDELVFEDINK